MNLSRKTSLYLAAAAIVTGGTIFGIIKLTNRTGTPIPSSNPLHNQVISSRNSDNTSNSPLNQKPAGSSVTNSTNSSGPPPTPPYGNFVSNHHPGGSAPTSEASTCNTTPYTSCYIQFTKGAEVKKLDSQMTNANGAAIWYWDVNSAGLSSGTWSITAVASLNGQSKSASDTQSLTVQ